MKFTMKLLSMLFAVLLLANVANADSPREQLDQKVMQLQKNPTDNALRANIIHLAQTLKPAPAIPEEARRHFVKAVTLQKEAKSAEDYDLPIQEYRQALLLAPWWSDAYFDLASALELKQQYTDAIQNLKFSILASPEGPDARAAQDKVYALEAKSEKKAKEDDKKAQKDSVAAEQERFYKSLDGGVWKQLQNSQIMNGKSVELNPGEDYIEVHGNQINRYFIDPRSGRHIEQAGAVFSNRKADAPADKLGSYSSYGFTISEDGKNIILEITGNADGGYSIKLVYQRIK
ncbi:MAG: hypothetical protein KGL01_03440 [Betaproteobacteria bacterium]|nr:hypothetical protein [Betaproteobacteria bacterium]